MHIRSIIKAPKISDKAIAACDLKINDPEKLNDWYIGLEKADAVMIEARAPKKACTLFDC